MSQAATTTTKNLIKYVQYNQPVVVASGGDAVPGDLWLDLLTMSLKVLNFNLEWKIVNISQKYTAEMFMWRDSPANTLYTGRYYFDLNSFASIQLPWLGSGQSVVSGGRSPAGNIAYRDMFSGARLCFLAYHKLTNSYIYQKGDSLAIGMTDYICRSYWFGNRCAHIIYDGTNKINNPITQAWTSLTIAPAALRWTPATYLPDCNATMASCGSTEGISLHLAVSATTFYAFDEASLSWISRTVCPQATPTYTNLAGYIGGGEYVALGFASSPYRYQYTVSSDAWTSPTFVLGANILCWLCAINPTYMLVLQNMHKHAASPETFLFFNRISDVYLATGINTPSIEHNSSYAGNGLLALE